MIASASQTAAATAGTNITGLNIDHKLTIDKYLIFLKKGVYPAGYTLFLWQLYFRVLLPLPVKNDLLSDYLDKCRTGPPGYGIGNLSRIVKAVL